MAKRKTAAGKNTASKRRKPGAGNGGIVPPPEHRFAAGNQAAVGHGRPRKLAELKELILETLAEDQSIATLDGRRETRTRAQWMIRTMLVKSPSDRLALLEYAFGKVPMQITIVDELLAWLRENAEALRSDPVERARVLQVLAEGGHDAAALFASVPALRDVDVVIGEDSNG